jgi:hypothetical protein
VEPSEALSLTAQVAVTLAGFAGVVVVFRPGSVHQWSVVDRFRLRLLLSNSIFPLAYSLIGISLLTITPTPQQIWRWCNALVVALSVPAAIAASRSFGKIRPTKFAQVNKTLFYSVGAIGTAALLLQLYNTTVLNSFWPFFVVIAVQLLTALLQFMRIVLLPPSD